MPPATLSNWTRRPPAIVRLQLLNIWNDSVFPEPAGPEIVPIGNWTWTWYHHTKIFLHITSRLMSQVLHNALNGLLTGIRSLTCMLAEVQGTQTLVHCIHRTCAWIITQEQARQGRIRCNLMVHIVQISRVYTFVTRIIVAQSGWYQPGLWYLIVLRTWKRALVTE